MPKTGVEREQWRQRIVDKEFELGGLYKRNDADELLRLMDDYKLVDSEKNPIKKVVNVTGNDAATFGDKIVSSINKADRHTVAEQDTTSDTQMSDDQTTKIEHGLDDMLDEGDLRLQNRGLPGLYPVVNEQACYRGRLGGRWLITKDKDGNQIVDILPMDTRYMAYDFGSDGLEWGSFRIRKSKASLRSTYGIDYSGNSGEIRELWTPEESMYWLDEKPLTRTEGLDGEESRPIGEKHKIGRPPIVVSIVSVGSFLQSKDSNKNIGESIFWMARKLFAEKNRCLSILQTQNLMSIRPPTQYESGRGIKGVLPDESPYELDSIVAIEKGMGYKEMPRQDMIAASRYVFAHIEQMIQRATLSPLDFGNLTFPLSGVTVARLTDEKSTIFAPRVNAISLFYQLGILLLLDQLEGSIDLGRIGRKTTYNRSDFDGDYEIKFTWKTLDPIQNIANYSLAETAKQFVSRDRIRRDIIQLDNPDEDANQMKAEDAYEESPILRKLSQVRALIATGKNKDAELMAHTELGMTIDQVKAGAMPEPVKPKAATQKPKATMPLFGEARGMGARPGRKTSAQEASEAVRTVAQEE